MVQDKWPMLSLWQKSGTNFMVRDKFVSDFQCSFLFVSHFSMLIITKLTLYRQQQDGIEVLYFAAH